jgi:hypothetical protein
LNPPQNVVQINGDQFDQTQLYGEFEKNRRFSQFFRLLEIINKNLKDNFWCSCSRKSLPIINHVPEFNVYVRFKRKQTQTRVYTRF